MTADLAWNPERLAEYAWLRPLLTLPDDASPPLSMSLPPADAVGSYGPEAVEWIESSQRIRLRWWQALAITRQLEHREDGSLCHRVVVESAPRRAGKSVRVRGLALWRMAHPELFGEVQTVIHTGSDVAICREIQRGAWRWAEEVAGWTVTMGNGKESIETPDGDRWLVRAQRAVYGYDVALGIVDEAWDVKPDTVSEGLEPATLERSSPQLHLTSTAHRRATSLMRSRLRVALEGGEDDTLLLLWGAPAGSDPGDPEVWRAASPHWSEDRRRMIADKYAKAVAGEADPQADDPDPMAGFTAQYLNIWPLREVAVTAIDLDAWANCLDPAPVDTEQRQRLAACVDLSPDGQHATLAVAVVLDDGRVRVETVHEWSGPDAAKQLERGLPGWVARVRPRSLGWFPTGPAAAVASRLADRRKDGVTGWPPPGVKVSELRGEMTAVCMGLAKEVTAGTLAQSGQDMLCAQVEKTAPLKRGGGWVFTRPGGGHCDAVYAVAGAAHLARTLPPSVGKPRLLVAT
ncbi:terminase [Micromonospora wenchangensis]|uniref:terminase n=1 Tax=Micromonospora wenchangensis TaxID=1185415 RepID=UPI003816000E